LLIGPWDHAGTRIPEASIGGLTFGPASVVDMNAIQKDWYDWTLKDGPPPAFLKSRVTYYLPPSDQWKYSDTIESIATATHTLYLASQGRANHVIEAGRLATAPPSASTPDRFTYDPMDTRPGLLETPDFTDVLTDQRLVMNPYGNGVIYYSDP